jgi:hypothetical protein
MQDSEKFNRKKKEYEKIFEKREPKIIDPGDKIPLRETDQLFLFNNLNMVEGFQRRDLPAIISALKQLDISLRRNYAWLPLEFADDKLPSGTRLVLSVSQDFELFYAEKEIGRSINPFWRDPNEIKKDVTIF